MKNLCFTKAKQTLHLFCWLISLFMFQGCAYYFKAVTINTVSEQEIDNFNTLNKYLIIHQGHASWHLSEVRYAGQELIGNLSDIDENHLSYQTADRNKVHRYKIKNKPYLLDQVHLFLPDSLIPDFEKGKHLNIPFSAFKKVEEYKSADGTTISSWLTPPIIVIGLFLGLYIFTTPNPFQIL